MGVEFFEKKSVNPHQEHDNFYYLPIVEQLRKENWRLATVENSYKHFYVSPEALLEGERRFIGDCSRLSCYKVNLTVEQVSKLHKGSPLLNGFSAAITIEPWQVACRIELAPSGHVEHVNPRYFKYAPDEINQASYHLT